MKIRSFVHRNLVVMEFPTLETMRKATFRYTFYSDASRPHFMKLLKEEETWGFFSDGAEDYSTRIKLDAPTREEKQFQHHLAKLTKGRYSKYSLIVYPKYGRQETLNHEISHFLYANYKSYQNRARDIVMSFKYLNPIRKHVKSYNDYGDSEVTEEIVSYLCEDQSIKIPYKKCNMKKINRLKRLYQRYLHQFFGEQISLVSKV